MELVYILQQPVFHINIAIQVVEDVQQKWIVINAIRVHLQLCHIYQ